MMMLPTLIPGVRQILGAGDRVRGAVQDMGIEQAIGKGKKARLAAIQMETGQVYASRVCVWKMYPESPKGGIRT